MLFPRLGVFVFLQPLLPLGHELALLDALLLYQLCVGGNYNYTDMVPERMAAVAMWNRELTDAEMKQAFLARNFNSMGFSFKNRKTAHSRKSRPFIAPKQRLGLRSFFLVR